MGGVIRVFLWLAYEFTKHGMNLFWLVYLYAWSHGLLELFAHMVGWLSFLYMISNIVWILTGTEV